jgi:maltose alpha-D-glucosyltransferase/alpha-amylase
VLQAVIANKALYELGYELNNRPDWLHIPLTGLLRLQAPSPA